MADDVKILADLAAHGILKLSAAQDEIESLRADVERLRKRMSGMRARAWTTIGNHLNSDNFEFLSKLQENVDAELTRVLEQEDKNNG